jgi:hypothetical protein
MTLTSPSENIVKAPRTRWEADQSHCPERMGGRECGLVERFLGPGSADRA